MISSFMRVQSSLYSTLILTIESSALKVSVIRALLAPSDSMSSATAESYRRFPVDSLPPAFCDYPFDELVLESPGVGCSVLF